MVDTHTHNTRTNVCFDPQKVVTSSGTAITADRVRGVVYYL